MEDPQSTPAEVFNVLELATGPEFVVVAEAAESNLLEYRDDEEALEDLIERYEVELTSELGDDFIDRDAKLEGIVFSADEDEVLIEETETIDTDSARFVKVTVQMISGEPRVVLMFQMPGFEEGDEFVEGETYYALPTNLFKLEIKIDPEGESLAALAEFAEYFRAVTSDPEFLALDLSEQEEVLINLLLSAHGQLPHTIDDTLRTEAEVFGCQHDDMSFLPLADCMTSQTDIDRRLWFKPMGEYEGLDFPELMGRSEPFRSQEDFSIGGGVPCLKLRDRIEAASFYIPIDKVEKVSVPRASL